MERKLTVAEIILIAGTRVALGAGIGLLLSTRLNNDQRKAAGLALALVGGLTTIPLALGVIGKRATTQASGVALTPLGGQIAARQSLRKSDEARGAHPIRWWRWVQAAMDLEAFSPAVARGQ